MKSQKEYQAVFVAIAADRQMIGSARNAENHQKSLILFIGRIAKKAEK